MSENLNLETAGGTVGMKEAPTSWYNFFGFRTKWEKSQRYLL